MTPGHCSARLAPAEAAPSGHWWHLGPACPNRSQVLFQVAVVEDGGMRSTTDAERPARFVPRVAAVVVRVLKWTVPVDDRPHEIGAGKVMHVACQSDPTVVQVWTLELGKPQTKLAQVFGTGQPLPGSVVGFIGSALQGRYVWHVFEVSL